MANGRNNVPLVLPLTKVFDTLPLNVDPTAELSFDAQGLQAMATEYFAGF